MPGCRHVKVRIGVCQHIKSFVSWLQYGGVTHGLLVQVLDDGTETNRGAAVGASASAIDGACWCTSISCP